MQKISSQFKRQMDNAGNISIVTNNVEGLILRALLWAFGALAIIYLIFLGNMVRNVVIRSNLEATTRTLSNEVGDLELTYLSASSKIDLATSYTLGFKDAKATYATRRSVGFVNTASTNINNIKLAQNEI